MTRPCLFILFTVCGTIAMMAESSRAQFVATMSELYRYVNVRTGDYLYTADRQEIDRADATWRLDGVAGYVLGMPEVHPSVPLYRYYDAQSGARLYTTQPSGDQVGAWISEGVVGYGFRERITGTVPLLEYLHRQSGDRYYTTDYAELGEGRGDWKLQCFAAFIYPPSIVKAGSIAPAATRMCPSVPV